MEINTQKLSPKFFFVSLGVLVALITTVTSLLNLIFETLDKKFPDALNATYTYGYNTYDYSAMRSSLATLIIIFPVFFVLTYFWNKCIKQGISLADTIVKKWMSYLIIFLSSIIIIVDLVTLVRYFVEGEITARFIYKILVTLLIALIAGMYYIYQLKDSEVRKSIEIICTVVTVGLVLFSIIFSFMIMGSPFQQRLLKLDQKRVEDLQNIQGQVINYWQQKEKLPETLQTLVNPLSGMSIPVDPEFEKGLKYEYQVVKPMTFSLCATFSAPMPKGWQEYNSGSGIVPMVATTNVDQAMYPYPGYGANDSWDHQTGRTCFERTIDKDIYPPYKKAI